MSSRGRAFTGFFKRRKIKIALASASKNGPFLLEKWVLHLTLMLLPTRQKQQTENLRQISSSLRRKAVGLKAEECIGIEDAQAGIQAILSSGAQPIGVGRAEDLGEEIPLVPDTTFLTIDYLKEKWHDHG